MTLADLKRRHNSLLSNGQRLYADLELMYREIIRLQTQIEHIEGADYDPVPLIFGSGFTIDGHDERITVPDSE